MWGYKISNFKNDMICKINRYFWIDFDFYTTTNLYTIGIDYGIG